MATGFGAAANWSDTELINAARAGSADAFDRLVEAHYRGVYNTAYRMLSTPSAASDATQSVFLRVYEALSSFRGDASFSTWLYRITMNVCLDELRKRKNEPLSLTEEDDDGEVLGERDLPDLSDEPALTAEQRELQRLVHEAIGRLSEDFRTVIVLYDIRGLSYQEISGVLEIPLGTVKSRLNRARLALRDEIAPHAELFGG
ncbi:MAG: sigma-70 family RNA polymerase sigma factor [candidate division WS1 bacterium]|jgi:RNA polymerase sigma-70 factor (ECF subfamily)|nr:sigma-70 family RNA polymerase sigma factor [candidate division WS1 bacterium]